jgi:hypothetical protein
MTLEIAIGTGLLLLLAALATVPRWLIRKGQDRLARQIVARDGEGAWFLLTRGDHVIGRYRRIPGVVGIRQRQIVFESRFEAPLTIPASEIRKVSTGNLLASGRRLARNQVLRIVRTGDEEFEFQISRASAHAWSGHLSAWTPAPDASLTGRVDTSE